MDRATTGLVVLGSMRKQDEHSGKQARKHHFSIAFTTFRFLPCFISCHNFLWWWTARWKCKLHKPFPSNLLFHHGVLFCCSSRNTHKDNVLSLMFLCDFCPSFSFFFFPRSLGYFVVVLVVVSFSFVFCLFSFCLNAYYLLRFWCPSWRQCSQ